MKKSRIAKFALLGASAAALAATLSTSTYAWYVTNKVANVNNGSAATGAAGSDGSILLSWTGNANTWFTSLDLANDQDKVVTYNSTNGLKPIHYDAENEAFYGINSNGSKGFTATDYFQFTIKVKSLQGTGKQTVVTPTFKFSNYGSNTSMTGTPAAPTTQQALTTTGAPDGVTQNQQFYVDAMNSLYVQQSVADGAITYSPANAQSCQVVTTISGAKTGGNAHTYYNAITDNTPWVQTTNWASGGLGAITVIEENVYTVTYTIFLDGGDTDCFNSAAGQSFKFELALTAADPTAYNG